MKTYMDSGEERGDEGKGGTFSSALSGVMCNTLRMSNSIRSTMMMSSSSRRSHSWHGHQHHHIMYMYVSD